MIGKQDLFGLITLCHIFPWKSRENFGKFMKFLSKLGKFPIYSKGSGISWVIKYWMDLKP